MFAPPAAQLMFDVAGNPVASPGRIDKNPIVDGRTTVTPGQTYAYDLIVTNLDEDFEITDGSTACRFSNGSLINK